jgi:hypothetical protein
LITKVSIEFVEQQEHHPIHDASFDALRAAGFKKIDLDCLFAHCMTEDGSYTIVDADDFFFVASGTLEEMMRKVDEFSPRDI